MSPTYNRMFFLVIATIFLIVDYFPDISLLSAIPNVLFFVLLIVYLFLSAFNRIEHIDKAFLRSQTNVIFYLIGLMIILSIFGGSSHGDISFKHGVFVILLFISLYDLLKYWRTVKKKEAYKATVQQ